MVVTDDQLIIKKGAYSMIAVLYTKLHLHLDVRQSVPCPLQLDYRLCKIPSWSMREAEVAEDLIRTSFRLDQDRKRPHLVWDKNDALAACHYAAILTIGCISERRPAIRKRACVRQRVKWVPNPYAGHSGLASLCYDIPNTGLAEISDFQKFDDPTRPGDRTVQGWQLIERNSVQKEDADQTRGELGPSRTEARQRRWMI